MCGGLVGLVGLVGFVWVDWLGYGWMVGVGDWVGWGGLGWARLICFYLPAAATRSRKMCGSVRHSVAIRIAQERMGH